MMVVLRAKMDAELVVSKPLPLDDSVAASLI
jgi:hypothetical protein